MGKSCFIAILKKELFKNPFWKNGWKTGGNVNMLKTNKAVVVIYKQYNHSDKKMT